jgi:hypothetical protein
MKHKAFKVLAVLSIISFVACSLNTKEVDQSHVVELTEAQQPEPHRYGGWYCPDNLNGFPAVDIADWKNVPVVNGRMATQEETRTEASLIFVDAEKYPNAKPLDITMPKLAKYYNQSSRREELIIVIQAINIQNDSIAGFRYLNGGNGSARLKNIKFLSDSEIKKIPTTRFVTHDVNIKASQDVISEVMRNPKHSEALSAIFDQNNRLNEAWRKTTNLNYCYVNAQKSKSAYADILFGNFYVQNDFDHLQYTEKFLLLTDQETKNTTLKIVCGPFGDDLENQKIILKNWGQKIKELSEME